MNNEDEDIANLVVFLVCLWVDGGGGVKAMLLTIITAIPYGSLQSLRCFRLES